MSHRSYLSFACSSRVNIYARAFNLTMKELYTVSQVKIGSYQIPTAMSDGQSSNTSLLEVMISSKNETVFIHDFSDRTLQIIFDASWATMNVGLKRSIAWNTSRHVRSGRFYLHCRTEETRRTGIICIVCNQVLCHPSARGMS